MDKAKLQQELDRFIKTLKEMESVHTVAVSNKNVMPQLLQLISEAYEGSGKILEILLALLGHKLYLQREFFDRAFEIGILHSARIWTRFYEVHAAQRSKEITNFDLDNHINFFMKNFDKLILPTFVDFQKKVELYLSKLP